MDNLTHLLTGIALSRLGPMREHRTAPALLLLAANAPDLDAYGWAVDPYTYLAHHRGYGHALVAAPLLALACVLLCKLALGTRVAWSTWAFSLIAVLSHDVLDWTNPYGVRWLLPFSGEWFSLNTTLPWDAAILGILLFTTCMPALLRLIDAWLINAPAVQRAGAAWTWIALAGLLAYGGTRWSTQEKALRMMRNYQYRPEEVTEMGALPARASLTQWRALVSVEGAMYELPVDTRAEFPYATPYRMPQPDPELAHLIEAARTSDAAKALDALGPLVFWRVSTETGLAEVRMIDARFGTIAEPHLMAVMKVREDGKVMTQRLVVGSDVY